MHHLIEYSISRLIRVRETPLRRLLHKAGYWSFQYLCLYTQSLFIARTQEKRKKKTKWIFIIYTMKYNNSARERERETKQSRQMRTSAVVHIDSWMLHSICCNDIISMISNWYNENFYYSHSCVYRCVCVLTLCTSTLPPKVECNNWGYGEIWLDTNETTRFKKQIAIKFNRRAQCMEQMKCFRMSAFAPTFSNRWRSYLMRLISHSIKWLDSIDDRLIWWLLCNRHQSEALEWTNNYGRLKLTATRNNFCRLAVCLWLSTTIRPSVMVQHQTFNSNT